jgi:hypothetical protein
MIARTKEAVKVRSYYLKMEEVFFKFVEEENKRRIQLIEQKAQEKIELDRHNMLRYAFKERNVVYFIKLFSNNDGSFVLKIGHASDVYTRSQKIATEFKCYDLLVLEIFECEDMLKFEKRMHSNPKVAKLKYDLPINGKVSTESFLINSIDTYKSIVRIAQKDVIYYKDKSRENKILAIRQIQQENYKRAMDIFLGQPDKCMKALSIIQEERLDSGDVDEKMLQRHGAGSSARQEVAPVSHTSIAPQDATTALTNAPFAQDVDDETDDDGASTNASRPCGGKVQVYDAYDTKQLLYVFDGIVEATRKFPGASHTHIKKMSQLKREYLSFRWLVLDINDPDPHKPRDIGPTDPHNISSGLIAKTNIERTQVIAVFASPNEAARDINIKCTTLIENIRNQTPIDNSLYMFWYRLSDDAQCQYLENNKLPVKTNHKSVALQQIDPDTFEVVATHASITDVKKKFKMSPRTIRNACIGQTIKHNYIWRYVNSDN